VILLTDKVWIDRAAIPRRVKIVYSRSSCSGVLRLETLDEIDKIVSFISLAMTAPIPFDAPVTTVVLLCSWFVVCSSGLGRLRLNFDFNSLVQ